MDSSDTAYQHGVHIKIEPTREEDVVNSPLLRLDGQGIPAIIAPNAQITFDTLKANLRFDSPALRAFTGFLAHVGGSWAFKEGTTLSDVTIDVPKNMPYPEGIADELYLGCALASTDGKPLSETKSATCSLVSTSFNTGFKLENKAGKINGTQNGTLPVLVARVAGTVTDRAIAGMRWRFHDWHDAVLQKGVVGADGVLRIPSDLPVWYVELTR